VLVFCRIVNSFPGGLDDRGSNNRTAGVLTQLNWIWMPCAAAVWRNSELDLAPSPPGLWGTDVEIHPLLAIFGLDGGKEPVGGIGGSTSSEPLVAALRGVYRGSRRIPRPVRQSRTVLLTARNQERDLGIG